MDAKVSILFTLCWCSVSGSGVGNLVSAPIVAATSSQYFTRTFNRLVEAPVALAYVLAPAVAPAVIEPTAVSAFPPIIVAPLEPAIPAVVPPARPTAKLPSAEPTHPAAPTTPNVATSIATAHAFAQPLLQSAPVPIPLDIHAPQFQLLPLGDNGAVNSANFPENIQISKNTKSVSSNNFESSSKSETKTSSHTEQSNQPFSNTQQNNGFQNQQQQFQSNLQQTYDQHQQLSIKQQFFRNQEIVRQQELAKQKLLKQENFNAKQNHQMQQKQLLAQQQQLYNQQQYKQQELARHQNLIKQEQFSKQKQLARQEWIRQQQLKEQVLRIQQSGKTTVEIVPVPLAYIAPPPLRFAPIRQLHTFIPAPSKIIAVPAQLRLAPFRTNERLIAYSPQTLGVNNPRIPPRPRQRDVEPTTLRIPRFNTVTTPPKK